ncbi:dTDP-4-amino-4,6-dideoxygalactose transaminase [Paraburkholderia sp. GAS42]|uniref:dTDP-4-amino-4,6-dideoxygalactose transaminase n=1 Tax=Paraburkholderia sp. GAS42 TaxID=3035135 RepID=UPI003D252C66
MTPSAVFAIPFNRPFMTGKEISYIAEAHALGNLAGDGPFTDRCQTLLRSHTGVMQVLLTHSCTAALEMAALLLELQPGDEVIMPSYTFVSTANAFALRGAIPVFVDIRPDTLNIDEQLVEDAITARTRAIVVVHYAGVACEMDTLLALANQYGLVVIEDAAQGVMSSYKGRALGALGQLGAYSFHETKNIISGEGGALLVNRDDFRLQAEIIREKGTDRSRFFRGEVDKYTWQSIGSSFLPSELTAAFLCAQLEEAANLTARRVDLWNNYHALLVRLEEAGFLRRPIIPTGCVHNGHMYYVILDRKVSRQRVLHSLKTAGIHAVFHYVPLHSAPAAQKLGRQQGQLNVTDDLASRLVRLPMWIGLTSEQQGRVVDALSSAIAAEGA